MLSVALFIVMRNVIRTNVTSCIVMMSEYCYAECCLFDCYAE